MYGIFDVLVHLIDLLDDSGFSTSTVFAFMAQPPLLSGSKYPAPAHLPVDTEVHTLELFVLLEV